MISLFFCHRLLSSASRAPSASRQSSSQLHLRHLRKNSMLWMGGFRCASKAKQLLAILNLKASKKLPNMDAFDDLRLVSNVAAEATETRCFDDPLIGEASILLRSAGTPTLLNPWSSGESHMILLPLTSIADTSNSVFVYHQFWRCGI